MCKVSTETKVYHSCDPKKDKTKILHEKNLFNIVLACRMHSMFSIFWLRLTLESYIFQTSLNLFFVQLFQQDNGIFFQYIRYTVHFQIDILVLSIIAFYCKILINYFSWKRYGLRIHDEYPLFSIVGRKLRSNWNTITL